MPMTNFRAEDMPKPGEAPEPTPEPETLPAPDPGVPVGTAAEVLAWVGDDVDRAKEALRVEKGNSVVRSSLVTRLERIADED